ncbi:hypothetical protein MARINON1_51605 [Marinobacter salarius]|nr:hypothetical protein MARINON1_51605 [Marinobacter salarius]
MVRRAFGFDQLQAVVIFTQVNGGPGHTEARFQLRTDGTKLEMAGKYLGAEAGMLVAAIMANFLAQQAGADTNGNACHCQSPNRKRSFKVRFSSLDRSSPKLKAA